MNLLHTIGLMTRAEHERVVADNDNRAYDSWIKMINERDFYVDEYKALEAKFKKAVTDLEKQAVLEKALRGVNDSRAAEITELKVRLAYAEPRAKKWDDSLKRSRDRKEAKKRVAKPLVAAEPPNRAADRKRMAGKRGKA